ncbi:MAG TPA: M4 family metallopeptidase [Chthoniobacterales bacterium]|nr:M4 family metallopeptidase [Chthoniobacterales bacterium]
MLNAKDKKVRQIALDNIIASAHMRAVRSALPPERAVMGFTTLTPGGKYREVYDGQHKPTNQLPGKLVRNEGQKPTKDPATDEAYDYAGDTYDFYSGVFKRDSLDNHGLRLISSVHVGQNWDNAFWNGRQMAYGDGDGQAFGRFTQSVDVVGHELTHGVVSYSADLVYQDEPGAMNEHFADVFGTLVKQWKNNQTVKQADWLLGKELVIPAPTRQAIRNMANPGTAFKNDPYLGTDPQPKHIKNKYKGPSDNGGVHINSGILNYAFYLAATAIGGKAWETVGPIWYVALTQRLVRTSSFADLAKETIDIAGKQGAAVQNAVKAAWKKVGL